MSHYYFVNDKLKSHTPAKRLISEKRHFFLICFRLTKFPHTRVYYISEFIHHTVHTVQSICKYIHHVISTLSSKVFHSSSYLISYLNITKYIRLSKWKTKRFICDNLRQSVYLKTNKLSRVTKDKKLNKYLYNSKGLSTTMHCTSKW